jgi:hypothetical protein
MLSPLLLGRGPTLAVAALLGMSLPGCSFFFSRGPSAPDSFPYFDCSTSYAPPVLDTVWAGLNGLAAASAAFTSEEEWTGRYDRSVVFTSGFIWLAVSGASAAYGYEKVGECRADQARQRSRVSRSAGPPSWPPLRPPTYASPLRSTPVPSGIPKLSLRLRFPDV